MKYQFQSIFRLILCMVLFSVLTFSGCQKYGSVNQKSYEFASSLYSICNRKDEKRVDVIEKMINESLESEEISNKEAGWLLEIVSMAKEEKWDQAMKDARVMMNEQND